jgi:hypothetical protein
MGQSVNPWHRWHLGKGIETPHHGMKIEPRPSGALRRKSGTSTVWKNFSTAWTTFSMLWKTWRKRFHGVEVSDFLGDGGCQKKDAKGACQTPRHRVQHETQSRTCSSIG